MNITQIQIAPVDNGFVIQAVSIDGDKVNKKLVTTSVEDTRKVLHDLADQFHVVVEKPVIVPATSIPAPSLPREPR